MHVFRPSTLLSAGIAVVLLTPFALAQVLATGDPRPLIPPHYPLVCTVLRAGFTTTQRATPPSSDDTTRLQAALASCSGTGKSVVLLPSGGNNAFFSGALTVNGEALVVGYGVTLFGNNYGTSQMISVTGTNAAIWGPGTIDGRGDLISSTPRLINVKQIQNFTAAYVTLEHAAKMHLYIEGGSGVNVWGITIATPANTKNTDGIDLDSLSEATVFASSIEDGDDGVAIKTNSGPASDITVLGNRFYGTHGMSIGSQTMYGVTNVLWEDNMVFGTDQWGNVSTDNNGINIKSDYDCGGPVSQVTYRNTVLDGVKHLLIFNTYYGSCSGTVGIPVYQNIVVDGVRAIDSQSGAYSEFEGYNAANPLELYLANVNLDQTAQQDSQYAIVGLDNSNITPAGTGVTTFDFHLWRPPFRW
ncbi:MAG TPA: glycosyl hydrolase family 28 protein [Acidobacteriaceae bacterium]|jgi:polygalacturonase|nr:glycosyl hydrolase family 28 protein [Acidobacteriaceae bacterium]